MKVLISVTVGLLAVLVLGYLWRPDIYVKEQSKRLRSLPETQRLSTTTTAKPFPVEVIPSDQATRTSGGSAMQDHLKVARFLRERGDYTSALVELEKARAMDPGNLDVQSELENVRKACIAERDTLKRADLKCL